MRRLFVSFSGIALILGFVAAPSASAQQSFSLYLGGFTPRALDARSIDDVLVQDGTFLSTLNQTRGVDISEFNNVTVGGEWLFALTHNVEGGLGIGFYQRAVPTVYTDLVNPDGTDIAQTIKLRIIPFTATVRVLPFGNEAPIQPYIGAGLGVYRWRYSETGNFVYPDDSVQFRNFVGSGGATGPTILGGVRVPIGSAAIGFEIRHQSGEGTVPADPLFTEAKIDLGGYNYLLTMNFKF
jgi:hypothetical protein